MLKNQLAYKTQKEGQESQIHVVPTPNELPQQQPDENVNVSFSNEIELNDIKRDRNHFQNVPTINENLRDEDEGREQ